MSGPGAENSGPSTSSGSIQNAVTTGINRLKNKFKIGRQGVPNEPPSYSETVAKDYEELARREQELETRAQLLHMRESQQLRNPPNWNQAQPPRPEHNWPPLPEFCPIQSCFYQDIDAEIPNEYQIHVRYLYYLWIAHAILYSLNLLVGILYLFAGGDQGKFFGLAFIYWAFFVPLSYICWFRPAYKAFKNNSSVLMKTFFIGLSCQFFICVLHFLGIHGSGSSGIIIGYNVLVGNGGGFVTTIGAFMIGIGIGFGCVALGDFIILVKIKQECLTHEYLLNRNIT